MGVVPAARRSGVIRGSKLDVAHGLLDLDALRRAWASLGDPAQRGHTRIRCETSPLGAWIGMWEGGEREGRDWGVLQFRTGV